MKWLKWLGLVGSVFVGFILTKLEIEIPSHGIIFSIVLGPVIPFLWTFVIKKYIVEPSFELIGILGTVSTIMGGIIAMLIYS